MARIVLDEDIQKSLAELLTRAGHEVSHVQQVGLRGAPDEEVFKFAQAEKAVLMTADVGLADVRRFAGEPHAGIVLLRMPEEMPVDLMNSEILRLLAQVSLEDVTGALIVVEPGSVRIRRTS